MAGTYEPERFKIVFMQETPLLITKIVAKRQSDRTVKVDWEIKNENDAYQYTTERSVDGLQFSGIITTESAGKAFGNASYTVNDLGASELVNYYRIKGIGSTGQVVMSEVVKVAEIPTVAKSEISVYPNPVVDRTIHLHFVNKSFGEYQVLLLSQDGKSLVLKNVKVNTKNQNAKVPTGFVTTGSYILEILSPSGESTRENIFIQ